MYCGLNSDTKSAIISSVPLAPFTDWKTGTVDLIALSKLGSFLRRAAIQECFPSASLVLTNTKTTPVPQEDQENKSKIQGFLAACHLVLDLASPSGDVIPQMALCQSEVFWTAVGSSSYSLACVVSHQPATGESSIRLGASHVTYVRIDPATRKPTPLTPEFREALNNELNPALPDAAGIEKLARLALPLPPNEVWSLATASSEQIRTALGGSPSVACKLCTEFFTIRFGDTDFNGHTNQLMYISFTIDAVRILLEQQVLQRGSHPNPSHGTDVKEVRIDYLREVRAVGTVVAVVLFSTPNSDPRVLWFAIFSLTAQSQPEFIAAQGFVKLQ